MTPIQIKLFSDLIDALGKVVGAVKSVANLPKSERDKYRQIFDETYRLIDTTLNMVIIRLGDASLRDDASFLQEVCKLDNYAEWIQAEREFRLCKSLRVALREMETISSRLAGTVSTKDWGELLVQMHQLLSGESDIAAFLHVKFSSLADSGRKAITSSESAKTMREQVTAFRNALVAEREVLIQQEAVLYTALV